MLQLLFKYPDPLQGLLANTNAGGENVARGAMMGAIYGFLHGPAPLLSLSSKLTEIDSLQLEIDQFIAIL
jgi:hypothetical protein